MTRTIIDHEQRFHEQFDHAGGRSHVEGAAWDALDRLVDRMTTQSNTELLAAEVHAWDLLQALKDAVAGAAHWRPTAQRLLREIANHGLSETK